MTTANPAFDGASATNDISGPQTHRHRGKRFFKLMVIVTAISLVVAKIRGHASPDTEDDYGD